MDVVEIIPYQELKNRQFKEVTLLILEKNFVDVDFIEGRITFAINDCDFGTLKIENPDKIDFEISLSFNSCFIVNLEVIDINSQQLDLIFFSSLISGRVRNKMLRNVTINNCILNNSLFVNDINSVNISFTNENVFPRIWRRLFKRLDIKDIPEVLKQAQSYYLEDIDKINFYTHDSQKHKGISRSKYTSLEDYKINYALNEEEKRQFLIALSIKYNPDSEHTYTKINNPYLYNLSFSGKPKGTVDVENGNIQRLYIHRLSPDAQFTFYNITPLFVSKTALIEIHTSNLRNTWFDNFNFIDYSTISFFRTKFNETSFTSCNFPKDSISFEKFKSLENIHYPESLKDNFYKDQYEIFLQLKNALEKSGNIYEAQKLQAISFDALGKIKDISNWDRIILYLNDFSNQHGLSIKRPLKWFLIFSIFFYLIYLYSLDRLFTNQNADWNLIGYYFSFIDLTHRSDFLVEKNEFTSISLIVDFLNKIVIGYFIYQFIASFRKYGKGK